jgi:hypothetical protein
MTQYKICSKNLYKIYQTKFEIESDKEINDADELNKPIIDFLGKSDIKWEKNDLQYHGAGNDFYITYEEVKNGSGQHDIVREETETRI